MKKRRTIKRTRKKKSQRKLISFVLGLLLVVGIVWGTFILLRKSAAQRIASDEGRNNLQLESFSPYATPSPTIPPTEERGVNAPISPGPTPACGIAGINATIMGPDGKPITTTGTDPGTGQCCIEDGAKRKTEECCPGVPIIGSFGGVYYYTHEPYDWCNAKPVIYLYPEKDTLVDVSVQVPGKISVSIPTYPTGGWNNILAKPNGKLIYQGETYSELFYESSVTPIAPPKQGFVIQLSNVQKFLKDLSLKLGLHEIESNELVSYWIPKLKALQSPYIFVSVFDQASKDKIDHVEITPKPNTFIQMIFYFKPLLENKVVEPLEVTPAPPRKGFTAVEWGGIIDGK